jgi:hypothetical protein
MKNNPFGKSFVALAACALSLPLAGVAQTTVFSDNFTGASTIQSATPGVGTASSADYEVFTQSSLPGAGASVVSIAANNLIFGTTNSTAVLGEVAANFTAAPVTLATVGDYINLTVTFVDTANVLILGQNGNASLNVGLFNTGGVNLNQGTRLDTGTTSGGSQNWQGYVNRLFLNGNSSTFNRKPQTPNGTTSQNQDLLFNNASSTAAFNNPSGTGATSAVVVSPGTTGGLTAGNTYTLNYSITYLGGTGVRMTNALYNGSTPTGSPLFDMAGTETNTSFTTASFDGLAFGYRQNNTTALTASLDISQITITDQIAPVPEPTILAVSAFGGLGMLAVRRWQQRK